LEYWYPQILVLSPSQEAAKVPSSLCASPSERRRRRLGACCGAGEAKREVRREEGCSAPSESPWEGCCLLAAVLG